MYPMRSRSVCLGSNVQAFDRRLAFTDRGDAGQHLDYGCLSAPVGTKKSEHFALLYSDRDFVHRNEIAEAPREISCFDSRHYRASGENSTSPLTPARKRLSRFSTRNFTPMTW
jgi:hypothetical protein